MAPCTPKIKYISMPHSPNDLISDTLTSSQVSRRSPTGSFCSKQELNGYLSNVPSTFQHRTLSQLLRGRNIPHPDARPLLCIVFTSLCRHHPLRGPPSPTSPPKATALHVTLSSTLPFPNLSTTGHFTLHCYSVGDLHVVSMH